MSSRMDRRGLLRRGATAGLGLMVLKDGRSAVTAQANEKLNIALVGVGGRGSWFVDCIPGMGENLVALCDVNGERAKESFARLPDAATYHDFRVMLAEMGERIDAVIVATPDHTHAPASIAAMRAGKPVLCEKPLTHNVREARLMRDVAREQRVATQMGNQGTASNAFRRALELIRQGTIGEVREVYVWKDSGGPGARLLPEGEQPVPEFLKWDLWLGPALDRPYHEAWWKGWHGWRDFGTGESGNWATHTANLAFKSLGIDSLWYTEPETEPRITVQAEVSEIDRASFPKWEKVHFSIPARGDLPPLTLHYYNGAGGPGMRAEIEGKLGRPLDWGDNGRKKWDDHAGTLIVGSEGKIWANGHNTEFDLLPAEKFGDMEGPPQTLPQSPGHEKEWLNAIRGGEPAWSNFEYADPLAEFLHLGNLATQFDYAVEFDPLACKIVNSEEADQALTREYRKGWEL